MLNVIKQILALTHMGSIIWCITFEEVELKIHRNESFC